MFAFRDDELALLEKDFAKPVSSFSFIFGRRKVGKTSLINAYIAEKNALYLSCIEMVPSLLFESLSRQVTTFFKIKIDEKVTDLKSLLTLIALCEVDTKTIIVFDDFHHLMKAEKKLLQTFYTYWGRKLKSKNIQIIICSSVHSSNKDDINIFNKASNYIRLGSLNFNIIKTLLPNLNKNDTMYVYSAFGTNPQYLALYDVKKDFILNIKDNFLNYDSFVFNEGFSIIKDELSEVGTYCSILYAIAMGNKKIGDVATFLSVKSSYLTRYMQKLVDIMILSKHIPVNDNPSKSKFGRYEIEDNFLKFWFCYIYPNSSVLKRKEYYPVISHIRRDFSNRLVKDAYKRYVLELIVHEPEKFLGYVPSAIGGWWNNKVNDIDIVAYNNKDITFINCKWRQRDSAKKSYEELKNNAQNFETSLNRKYTIFAKNITAKAT